MHVGVTNNVSNMQQTVVLMEDSSENNSTGTLQNGVRVEEEPSQSWCSRAYSAARSICSTASSTCTFSTTVVGLCITTVGVCLGGVLFSVVAQKIENLQTNQLIADQKACASYFKEMKLIYTDLPQDIYFANVITSSIAVMGIGAGFALAHAVQHCRRNYQAWVALNTPSSPNAPPSYEASRLLPTATTEHYDLPPVYTESTSTIHP